EQLGKQTVAREGTAGIRQQDLVRSETDLEEASGGGQRDLSRPLRERRTENYLARMVEQQAVELGDDVVFNVKEEAEVVERQICQLDAAGLQAETQGSRRSRGRLQAGREGRRRQLRAGNRD